MSHELEETDVLRLDFAKTEQVARLAPGVIPVVVQNVDNGMVIMVGYVNRLALETAQTERRAVFWSTSRQELWIKGATSGDALALIEVRVNCEQNSVLYLVRPEGRGACHTRDAHGQARPSCFYRLLRGGRLENTGAPPAWGE